MRQVHWWSTCWLKRLSLRYFGGNYTCTVSKKWWCYTHKYIYILFFTYIYIHIPKNNKCNRKTDQSKRKKTFELEQTINFSGYMFYFQGGSVGVLHLAICINIGLKTKHKKSKTNPLVQVCLFDEDCHFMGDFSIMDFKVPSAYCRFPFPSKRNQKKQPDNHDEVPYCLMLCCF